MLILRSYLVSSQDKVNFSCSQEGAWPRPGGFFVAPTAFPGAEEGSLSWGEGVPSGGVSMAEGAVVMPVPSNHVRIVCLSCTLSRFVAATANSLLSHYCFQ